MPVPIVAVGAAAALLGAGRRVPASDGQWSFPLPAWRGYAPTVSDGYSPEETATHRSHHGCDLMYRRKGATDAMWTMAKVGGMAYGTKLFFVPQHTYACAARDGVLWEVGTGPRGSFVVIDHGKPWATFYQHMSSVLFGALQRGAGAIKVKAGQPLGIVGGDPSTPQAIVHLHFEVWYQGGANAHVDPWPLIARAPLPTVVG